MSDFDTGDCGGLGTLLKRDPVPNTCIEFNLIDWVKDSSSCPEVYVLDFGSIPACPIVRMQESVSVSSYVDVGVVIEYSPTSLRASVICDPDCRFPGRILIDG